MQKSTSNYHDVVIIGAGLSGIGAACHLQAALPDIDYIILEGRDRMGGTWDLFRYPGIRSDSDMHTLGFHFKPWKEAKVIADGPAILKYIRETAAEYGIEERIRYQRHLKKAEWSNEDCTWMLTVESGESKELQQIRCGFLLMCAGYYSYEQGHTPDFPGRERFAGRIVHPQDWPEDLDYGGKRIVVIGSGATAVTLLPELAKIAAHVTMLQRSPTYMIAFPDEDIIANVLGKVLPARVVYRFTRWKNIRLQALIFRIARKRPKFARWFLVGHARRVLGPDFDVDKHFNPHYDPWEQRLCLVPNDDLFDTLRSGQASVVTDRIRTINETGILLESGESIDADIIVTATGLDIVVLGGVEFHVDGRRIDFSKAFTYRGAMVEGVPNMSSTFGYINASWTLRADLIAGFACRILEHMKARGHRKCVPVLRAEDEGMESQPWITGFSSGYLQRVMGRLPKQGDREPWLNSQNYLDERRKFLEGTLDDGALRFGGSVRAGVDTAA
jgi:cation diffusion facilitator CzcD-associated flavoprotein CzcO